MGGHSSVISVKIRYRATMARNCGNSWISSTPISPIRRPVNRNREKAKAAHAERNIDSAADATPMIRVFRNHRGNDPLNVSPKFSKLILVGNSCDELSVPSGFRAAETTNRIGKIEKARATT